MMTFNLYFRSIQFVYFFISIFLVTFSFTSKAEKKTADDVIIDYNGIGIIPIGKSLYILHDSSNVMTFSEILTCEKFVKSEINTPNLGVSSNTYWIKFTVRNNSNDEKILLELAQPTIDEISFYYLKNNQYYIYKTGDHIPFHKRNLQYPNHIFRLKIKTQTEQTYYLKIKGEEQILLPFSLGSSKSILERLHHEDLIFGIYCGIMLVMFFYNLFIYYSVKDKIYLYYVIHILFIGFTQACLLGYPFQYLWPNNPEWANLSVYIFPCCVGITGLFFLRYFLETEKNTPRLHKVSYIIIGMYITTACLSLLGILYIAYPMVQISAMVVAIYMLIVAIVIAKQGSKPAMFFLIGWSIMLVGIVIFVLKDFGILEANLFTNYTMPAGSALETILLSFALADKINVLQDEKAASQAEVFEALQENEKLITEQNIVLEKKVEERTYELNTTNKELNTTLKNLKDTQAQLVDAEKMASLGQLTAGIAHEINNPINFVSANVKPLQLDIDDILSLIHKYENLNPNEDIDKQLKDIDKYKKQIDLSYLQEEIKTLLHGISDGASRTAEIVKGLRNFSRLDEGDIKTANLNEGIQSTLTILRSAMPENIKIVLNLADIPPIECFPGKLNQVFMNAINNSVHAMQKNKSRANHLLTISTSMLEHSVSVCIEDTGTGMTDEVKQKIFEPFFTTKDVGEGTGLGMSIVFKIIESHGGTIDVQSEINKGTKITFTLPKKIVIS